LETGELECRRGEWNSTCSGEMRRDVEEHQWRIQIIFLMRRNGISQDTFC